MSQPAFLKVEAEVRVTDLLRTKAALTDSTLTAYERLLAAERSAREEAVRIADEALKAAQPGLWAQATDTGTLLVMVAVLTLIVIGQSY